MSIDIEVIASGVVLAAYVAGATLAMNRIRHKRAAREIKEKKNNGEFEKTLISSIQNKAIDSINDVNNIYMAQFRLHQLSAHYHSEITFHLRNALSTISSERNLTDQTRNARREIVNKLIDDSNELYKKENQKVPFTDAPSPERGLLTDVLELSDKGNDLILSKLTELSNSIVVRQETISRLSDEKGTSLKWAKWGVFGTVLFSGVSIALTIYKW